jgi:hypothetical protein
VWLLNWVGTHTKLPFSRLAGLKADENNHVSVTYPMTMSQSYAEDRRHEVWGSTPRLCLARAGRRNPVNTLSLSSSLVFRISSCSRQFAPCAIPARIFMCIHRVSSLTCNSADVLCAGHKQVTASVVALPSWILWAIQTRILSLPISRRAPEPNPSR